MIITNEINEDVLVWWLTEVSWNIMWWLTEVSWNIMAKWK